MRLPFTWRRRPSQRPSQASRPNRPHRTRAAPSPPGLTAGAGSQTAGWLAKAPVRPPLGNGLALVAAVAGASGWVRPESPPHLPGLTGALTDLRVSECNWVGRGGKMLASAPTLGPASALSTSNTGGCSLTSRSLRLPQEPPVKTWGSSSAEQGRASGLKLTGIEALNLAQIKLTDDLQPVLQGPLQVRALPLARRLESGAARSDRRTPNAGA